MEQSPDNSQPPNTGMRDPAASKHSSGKWLTRTLAILLIFGLGLMTGGVLVHFGLERPALDAARLRLEAQAETLAATRGRLIQAENALAELDGRLRVEESTRRGLEASLRTTQVDLGKASDTIAFYEQLMPPGPKGAISIRALEVAPEGPHLKYRVLLMRSGANDRSFSGSLRFVAKGMLNDKPAEIVLKPAVVLGPSVQENTRTGAERVQTPAGVTGDSESDAPEDTSVSPDIPLEFADFQRSSGLLDIPPGFVVESVTATVLEGRKVLSSRTHDFSSDP